MSDWGKIITARNDMYRCNKLRYEGVINSEPITEEEYDNVRINEIKYSKYRRGRGFELEEQMTSDEKKCHI